MNQEKGQLDNFECYLCLSRAIGQPPVNCVRVGSDFLLLDYRKNYEHVLHGADD